MQRRHAQILTALGASAIFIQMIGLPVVAALLAGDLWQVPFTLLYFNLLATLFGIHILIWNAASVGCFALGLRLAWRAPKPKSPGEPPGKKRKTPPSRWNVGLALTLVPVLLITLLLIFGEGHGA